MVGLGRSQGKRFNEAFSLCLEQPSQEDIDLELGSDYVQSMNYDKTAVRKPSQCLCWPVYNWDAERVQVLEVSHISLARQFAKYGLNKKYSRNLLDWDFELSKIKADMVKYELLIVPRDEDEHDEAAMEKAWNSLWRKLVFDLNRIVTGGDPFSEPSIKTKLLTRPCGALRETRIF